MFININRSYVFLIIINNYSKTYEKSNILKLFDKIKTLLIIFIKKKTKRI